MFLPELDILLDVIYLQSKSVSKISDMKTKENAVSLCSRAMYSHA